MLNQEGFMQAIAGQPAIDATLRNALSSFADKPMNEVLKVPEPDIAVLLTTRYIYPRDGDPPRFSEVRVFYKGDVQLVTWQYVDQYNYALDRRDLQVIDLGEITVTREADNISVTVELIPPEGYAKRSHTFNLQA